MPRYQVPAYICVDAHDEADARSRAIQHIRSNFGAGTFFYVDTLLPTMELEDGADDPPDLEEAVRVLMGE